MKLPSSFSLIGSAWEFYKKQAVLGSVLLWLIFLPSAISNILSIYMLQWMDKTPTAQTEFLLLLMLGMVACALLALWGTCCVLIVGKRIMQASAGRSRTSFSAVRSQAKHLILPILLTSILRTVSLLLWTLLLIIPGIIYAIRTTLFSIVIACEGVEYRNALKRSSQLVRPHIFQVLTRLLVMGLVFFLPITILQMITESLIPNTEFYGKLIATVPLSGLTAFSAMLFLLSLMHLYKSLAKPSRKYEQYNPPIERGE